MPLLRLSLVRRPPETSVSSTCTQSLEARAGREEGMTRSPRRLLTWEGRFVRGLSALLLASSQLSPSTRIESDVSDGIEIAVRLSLSDEHARSERKPPAQGEPLDPAYFPAPFETSIKQLHSEPRSDSRASEHIRRNRAPVVAHNLRRPVAE